MTLYYPDQLPRGLYSGRTYQLVSPLQRSELTSGRARQRRRFTSVPEMVQVSWLFNDTQGVVFEAWWRDVLIDGSQWFEMPLDHPLGYSTYTARFTDVYTGPARVGPELWSYSATLEVRERIAAPLGYGEFPEYIANADIFDIAMNQLWPLNPWHAYAVAADRAINEDWPTP